MNPKIPHSPFVTHLSGSAKDAELRIRSIFRRKEKRPPNPLFILTLVLLMSCFGLVSCQVEDPHVEDSTTSEDVYLVRTAQVLSKEYDFTHDGTPEVVELATISSSNGGETHISWYELQVKTPDSTLLWSEKFEPQHPGWNSLFVCSIDDENYLLRYTPTMYQGICSYSYQVFSLNTDGTVIIERERNIDFDTNFSNPIFTGFDANAVADFLSGVNNLLAQSKLLFSTDEELENIDPDAPQHIPSFLTSEYLRYLYDPSASLRQNLLALEYAGREIRGEETNESVFVSDKLTSILHTPMDGLTQEQKDLLTSLPAEGLPRHAVDLHTLHSDQIWQDLLIPLAYNETYDVTLYGVINAESSFFQESQKPSLATDGMILRVGDRTVYAPIPWYDNIYLNVNPWMEVDDFDGDNRPEAAVSTHCGRGTGVSMESLFLFDLDTLAYSAPDLTTLDIDTAYNTSAHCITLTAGEHSALMELSSFQGPPVSAAPQIHYSCDNGQLICRIGLQSYGYGIGSYAEATAPVIWNGSAYCLGSVTALTVD